MPNNQSLNFSPDGRWLAYLQGREPKLNAYMQDRLFIVPAAGGIAKSLSERLDRAVMSYAFESADRIAVAIEDDTSVYPAHIDIAGGAIDRRSASALFAVSGVTAAHGHTAMLLSDDAHFAEVYAWEAGQMRALTARMSTESRAP